MSSYETFFRYNMVELSLNVEVLKHNYFTTSENIQSAMNNLLHLSDNMGVGFHSHACIFSHCQFVVSKVRWKI